MPRYFLAATAAVVLALVTGCSPCPSGTEKKGGKPEDGVLECLEPIEGGTRLHGPYKRWHPGGQLAEEGTYEHGEKKGVWKTWWDNGNLEKEAHYQAGSLDGPYRSLARDGAQVIEAGSYAAGKKTGQWTMATSIEENQVDGTTQETWVDGKLHGPTSTRRNDGTLESQGAFDEDQLHGVLIHFASDGATKVEETTWNHGERHGPYKRWSETGKLLEEGAHQDSNRHGPWLRYAENGQKLEEQTYVKGQRDGAFQRWDEEGRLVESGTYKLGQAEGAWLTWFTTAGGKRGQRQVRYVGGAIKGKPTFLDEAGKQVAFTDLFELPDGQTTLKDSGGNTIDAGLMKRGRRSGVWNPQNSAGEGVGSSTWRDGQRHGAFELTGGTGGAPLLTGTYEDGVLRSLEKNLVSPLARPVRRWTAPEPFAFPPFLDGGVLYGVTRSHAFIALPQQDGESQAVAWRQELGSPPVAAPVYVAGATCRLQVLTQDGALHAFDHSKGKPCPPVQTGTPLGGVVFSTSKLAYEVKTEGSTVTVRPLDGTSPATTYDTKAPITSTIFPRGEKAGDVVVEVEGGMTHRVDLAAGKGSYLLQFASPTKAIDMAWNPTTKDLVAIVEQGNSWRLDRAGDFKVIAHLTGAVPKPLGREQGGPERSDTLYDRPHLIQVGKATLGITREAVFRVEERDGRRTFTRISIRPTAPVRAAVGLLAEGTRGAEYAVYVTGGNFPSVVGVNAYLGAYVAFRRDLPADMVCQDTPILVRSGFEASRADKTFLMGCPGGTDFRAYTVDSLEKPTPPPTLWTQRPPVTAPTWCGAHRGSVVVQGKAGLAALSDVTGATRWSVDSTWTPWTRPVAEHSESDFVFRVTPVFFGDLVISFSGDAVTARHVVTGEVIWTYVEDPGATLTIQPVVLDGTVFIAYPSGLQALDAESGTPLWRAADHSPLRLQKLAPDRTLPGDGGQAALAATDGRVVLVEMSGLQAFDARTGKPLWKKEGEFVPVVHGADERIFAIQGGKILAFGAELGERQWRYETKNAEITSWERRFQLLGDTLLVTAWAYNEEPGDYDARIALSASGGHAVNLPSEDAYRTNRHPLCQDDLRVYSLADGALTATAADHDRCDDNVIPGPRPPSCRLR